jgi:hypothetical protein
MNKEVMVKRILCWKTYLGNDYFDLIGNFLCCLQLFSAFSKSFSMKRIDGLLGILLNVASLLDDHLSLAIEFVHSIL